MSKPRVSIVIVNWKTPELLAAALRSILADSNSRQFEVWVVDNNSGDHSVEMLKRDFPSVITVANTENVGFARACNQVIPLASGDHILLVNPDTVASPQAVSHLLSYMDAHPECGAVGPKVLNPDGSLQLSCRRSFPNIAASFFRLTYLSLIFPKHRLVAHYNLTYADPDLLLEVDALSGAFMMLRKTAVERIGLLDEDIFMFGEDIDWCWRVKQDGWKVVYEPKAVVYHYHGASSRLRRVGAAINLHKGMEVFYRKHMAPRNWSIVNWFVYAAIWSRAAVYVSLSALQNLIPEKKIDAVLATDVSEFIPPAAQEANDRTPIHK